MGRWRGNLKKSLISLPLTSYLTSYFLPYLLPLYLLYPYLSLPSSLGKDVAKIWDDMYKAIAEVREPQRPSCSGRSSVELLFPFLGLRVQREQFDFIFAWLQIDKVSEPNHFSGKWENSCAE